MTKTQTEWLTMNGITFMTDGIITTFTGARYSATFHNSTPRDIRVRDFSKSTNDFEYPDFESIYCSSLRDALAIVRR